MKTKSFIEGLQLLNKYFDDTDGYNINAEHDEFFVHSTDRPVSTEDFEKLKELGWRQEHWEEDNEEYSPDECWTVYV